MLFAFVALDLLLSQETGWIKNVSEMTYFVWSVTQNFNSVNLLIDGVDTAALYWLTRLGQVLCTHAASQLNGLDAVIVVAYIAV